MFGVSDKLAVITGGTRGIGLAIAEALLAMGGRVVLNGRSATEESAALVSKFGADRVAIELGDVSDPIFAKALIDRSAKKFGRLDILVHSAGGPVPGKITDITAETWMNALLVACSPGVSSFQRGASTSCKRRGCRSAHFFGGWFERLPDISCISDCKGRTHSHGQISCI